MFAPRFPSLPPPPFIIIIITSVIIQHDCLLVLVLSLVLHYLLYSSQLSQGCSFSPHFTNEELKPRVAKRCSGLRPHRLYMAKLGPESASWDYSSKASPLTLFSSTAIFMKTIRKLRVTGLWWSFARGGNRAGGDVSWCPDLPSLSGLLWRWVFLAILSWWE